MGGHFIKFIYFFFLTLIRDNTNKKNFISTIISKKRVYFREVDRVQTAKELSKHIQNFKAIFEYLFKFVQTCHV